MIKTIMKKLAEIKNDIESITAIGMDTPEKLDDIMSKMFALRKTLEPGASRSVFARKVKSEIEAEYLKNDIEYVVENYSSGETEKYYHSLSKAEKEKVYDNVFEHLDCNETVDNAYYSEIDVALESRIVRSYKSCILEKGKGEYLTVEEYASITDRDDVVPMIGCEVAIFGSDADAREWMAKYDKYYNIVESTGQVCKHCGSPLFKSDIEGYETQCFHCDEDFYSIEQ